jgi:O-antigen ligase
MQKSASDRYLGMYVLAAASLVSLFVSPWNSLDPVNLPKLFLLSILGFIAGGFAISRVDFLVQKKNRLFVGLVLVFLMQLIFVMVVDPRDFAFKFYGTSSRNTGVLAYIALALLLFGSAVSASGVLVRRYAIVLIFSGATAAVYGVFQWRGIDFYEFDNAYATNVFGTFGNPNFQSAFMGISATVALTWLFFSRIKLIYKVLLIVFVALALFNMSLSSEQGFLTLAAGVAAALIMYLWSTGKKVFGAGVLALSLVGGFLVFLGIFNRGPIADLIYKSSLQARGFYWQAALNMIADNPISGVGIDGFGDWYLRSRTQEIANFNAGISADTAHNIPLDIGSGGGIPLLAIYTGLVLIALISVIRVVTRGNGFNLVYTSIAAAWFAYQAQSLISINQLGLGVWGWTLTGLLIGYELNTREEPLSQSNGAQKRSVKKREQISALAVVSTFVFGGIGLAAAIPPYAAAGKFYTALQSGDAEVIQPAAYLKPYDRSRFLYVARILVDNKLDDRARTVLRDASKIYPDSISLWQIWASIPSAPAVEIAKAKSEMKRLDPFNPGLK